MKLVSLLATVDSDLCNGCVICRSVCPTLSITLSDRLAIVDNSTCSGCGACEQRCPTWAIHMIARDHPALLTVDASTVDQAELRQICKAARHHPEEVICYCTGTRAREVAAAILKGARSPEDISRMTGVRTGCKVECIQPVLRLLEAAGIQPERPRGWQWYGRTVTAWELPDTIKAKYAGRGFHFDEDCGLLEEIAVAG